MTLHSNEIGVPIECDVRSDFCGERLGHECRNGRCVWCHMVVLSGSYTTNSEQNTDD